MNTDREHQHIPETPHDILREHGYRLLANGGGGNRGSTSSQHGGGIFRSDKKEKGVANVAFTRENRLRSA